MGVVNCGDALGRGGCSAIGAGATSIEIVAATGGGGSMANVAESQSEVASRKRCVAQTRIAAPRSAQSD